MITGSFPPMRCGVGDYTSHLAHALAARDGIEVAVLTSREAASGATAALQLFPVIDGWRFTEVPQILRVLRAWRPDVIHVQYPTKGYRRRLLPMLLPLICRMAGFRVAQTWHEYRSHVTLPSLIWFAGQLPVSGGVVFVRPRFEELMATVLRASLRGKVRTFIPNASVIPRTRLDPAQRHEVVARYGRPPATLVVYFGFVFAGKGIDLLFRIAEPRYHHLVIVGELGDDDPYHREIVRLATTGAWAGHVTLAGFLAAEEVGRIVAAADAVVLPFVDGGGEWNTSLHGAQTQGTFVLTTSKDRNGYDAARNTYFAKPGDVDEMRDAMTKFLGRKNPSPGYAPSWDDISAAHAELYERVVVS